MGVKCNSPNPFGGPRFYQNHKISKWPLEKDIVGTLAASTYVHSKLHVVQFEHTLPGICPPSPEKEVWPCIQIVMKSLIVHTSY